MKEKKVSQLCLRQAWINYKNYPGSKIMLGPGLGDDTRHFWLVKADGTIIDTVPGYGSYPYYSKGKLLDIEKNKEFLDKI